MQYRLIMTVSFIVNNVMTSITVMMYVVNVVSFSNFPIIMHAGSDQPGDEEMLRAAHPDQ